MLSVIIPTRNRSNHLATMLSTLELQVLSKSRFEILVIDNGSTDETRAVFEAYRSNLENMRYFFDATPGLHVGRHIGLQEANGDILVYADDDIEATPGWLAAIAECFADPDVALVGGNNLPKFATPPPDWLLRLWRRPFLDGHAIPALSVLELPAGRREISPFYIWGCNFSIRKQVLLDAGGFHPDGMPQDLIRLRGDGETHVSRHVLKSGLKCIFHPGASVYHKVTPERMTFAYFRQRSFNQGVSDSYTSLRNRSAAAATRYSLLRRAARWGWQRLKDLMLFDSDVKRALHEMKIGYREGYAYHQQMYQEYDEVRAWVHKPLYFQEQD